MSSYRDLEVWKQSFEVAKRVYDLCSRLPATEKYGLVSQVQRSAVSIPSNIAEGQQRNSNKEFKHFLSIARGSAAELSTQLLLIQDIYTVDCTELLQSNENVQKMLYSLGSKL